MRLFAVALGALLVVLGSPAAAQNRPNILLIIGDDIGVDKVNAYGECIDAANTPILDLIAERGVLFRNVWSNPFCSPTRATLLTGRYGFRTGIGHFIDLEGDLELSLDEETLPEILAAEYHTAAVGKWHLSGAGDDAFMHPLLSGFDRYSGSISNIDDYYDWDRVVDGVVSNCTDYATVVAVDDALDILRDFRSPAEPTSSPTQNAPINPSGISPLVAPLLASQGIEVSRADLAGGAASQNEPWFLWMAFNAPHKPFHHPPSDLHSYTLPADVDDSPEFMKAMTEAMDAEIGRLLLSLPIEELANTVIIFVGDNGTHQSATESPFLNDHAKGTVYEGGINVPLMVVGPGIVPGAECRRLVNVSDLYATIAELGGVEVPLDIDSTSIVPYFSNPGMSDLRDWVYTERFYPNGLIHRWLHIRAVREARYKLIEKKEHGVLVEEEFFDLTADPFEQVNLLENPHAGWQWKYNRLRKVLDQLEPPPPPPPPPLQGARSGASGSLGF